MQTLSSQLTTLTSGGRFGATVIARATLPDGVYAMSDSMDEFTWNGQSYLAMGHAFQVQVGPATSIGRQQPAKLILSYDINSLSTILAENYRRAPTTISVLFRDLSTNTFIAEVPCFIGYLDTAEINIAEGRMDQPDAPMIGTCTFTVQPRSAKLDRVGVRTRSDADQRAHRDANDGFFKDVGQAAKSQINWGRAGPNSPASTYATGNAGGYGLSPQGIVNSVLDRIFHQ